jgi:hypothetical protein
VQTKAKNSPRKRVFKLALADATFGHAQALIHFWRLQKLDDNSAYYPGIAAGIVVTYMRPFEDADNLGPLAQSFQKFPSDLKSRTGHSFVELHDEMKRMRYRLFAHFDLHRIPELTQHIPNALPPDKVEFTFAQGCLLPRVVTTLPSPVIFEGADDLIRFQRDRVMQALRDELRTWLSGLPKDGNYLLTDSGLEPLKM